MNVQFACTLARNLTWISDGVTEAGMTHAASVNPDLPRPPELGKEFNTQVNKICHVIEQVITKFKTLADYAHQLSPTPATFTTTISTVIALRFNASPLNNPH